MTINEPLPGCETEGITFTQYEAWTSWRNGERDEELEKSAGYFAYNHDKLIAACKELSHTEAHAFALLACGVFPQGSSQIMALLMPPDHAY